MSVLLEKICIKLSMIALAVILLNGALLAEKNAVLESSAVIEFYHKGEVGQFVEGAKLFTNRDFTLNAPPEFLRGKQFLRSNIKYNKFRVITGGFLTALTPESNRYGSSQVQALEASGFQRVVEPELFQLFGMEAANQVRIYRKRVKGGESYRFDKWTVFLGFSSATKMQPQAWDQKKGELLYNGIRLPKEWPPRDIDTSGRSPMPVPYLESPPPIIPIDVGRQLFVDDFLIESTELQRAYHMPRKYENNPVLKPETPIELGLVEPAGHTKPYGHGNAGAGPKSGGCWWDPDDQLFKLWYETSWFGPIAMAVSQDGLHWERPEFDVRPGTNIVSPLDLTPDSWTVVRNWDATSPEEKWALYLQPPGKARSGYSMVSSDGIHWERRVKSGVTGDRSTHFYNPFRKKWVYSLRTRFPGQGRAREYYEGDDFLGDAQWTNENKVAWAMADELDPGAIDGNAAAQLYNLDAVAYESIMLGIFEIHRGPDNKTCVQLGIPKTTELNFAYSRDGFHWDRPDRRAHIPSEQVDVWDRGYVQSLGNVCTIVGDQMLFYYIGFRGNTDKAGTANGMYDRSATGVAILRRDGFASMDAGAEPASLVTRPVLFSGKHLFVNVDAPQGVLRAEVLDGVGEPIEPFTLKNCLPVTADSTLTAVQWSGANDLSALSGKPVQFRFELANGSLYSFWVSQDASGRSDGYVAGGGPGYTGPIDTVGQLK